ncbi:hypothetical protein V6N11_061878 [Hibiscus sabdariffa]|uniref:Uncharacterized protein n=2 Tax=Hibiscus sabdariffa TaxID=183260 RepID=A0ABR2EBC1_9ROSI
MAANVWFRVVRPSKLSDWCRVVQPSKLSNFMNLAFGAWLMTNLRGRGAFAVDVAGWDLLFRTVCWILWRKRRCKQVMEADPGESGDPLVVGKRLATDFASCTADRAKSYMAPCRGPDSAYRFVLESSC